MKIEIVVACDEKFGIGKNGQLLWQLPDDLKFFKQITLGHPVIMGKNTYQSIPQQFRPLPGRKNLVISRTLKKTHDEIEIFDDIDKCLRFCQRLQFERVMVIGGGLIYQQFMERNLVDTIYFTLVHAIFDADTFFPYFNRQKWNPERLHYHAKDQKHNYDFTFFRFDKK